MGTFHYEANLKFRPQDTERKKDEYWIERVQSATYDDVRKKVELAHSGDKIDRVRERYGEQGNGHFVNSIGSGQDNQDELSQDGIRSGNEQLESQEGTHSGSGQIESKEEIRSGSGQMESQEEIRSGSGQMESQEEIRSGIGQMKSQKGMTSSNGNKANDKEIPDMDIVEDDKSVDKEEFEYKKQQEIGQSVLKGNKNKPAIHLLNIIGEVEGHIGLPQQTKATKYEHIIPELAAIENNDEIKGVLILLNTVGGDVEAGLAISELISSISKPTVSLVLGGSHSIGVPLAVAANYSFIVPSATMIIHPVRMNGTVIGIPQTFEYFERMQERILDFIVRNSNIAKDRLKELMMDTGKLARDVGSILVGIEAVHEGIINEIGGIKEAFDKLYEMIKTRTGDSGEGLVESGEESEDDKQ